MSELNLGIIAILLLILGSICMYGIGRSMARVAEREEEENTEREEE